MNEVENQQQVQELAKRLGCLPLALAQACAYMRDKQLSISDYLCFHETEK